MSADIVIINGSGGSGKDTFVDFVSQFAYICNLSSIDIIKKIAVLLGWDGSKDEKGRRFLSELKAVTNRYSNFIYDKLFEDVESASRISNMVFIHIREINEIVDFKRRLCDKGYNVTEVIVINPQVDLITSNNSDMNVFSYNYQYTIFNDSGLDELERMAKQFVDSMQNKSNKNMVYVMHGNNFKK